MEWNPNFNLETINNQTIPKWVSFKFFPMELLNEKILKQIRYYLGGFWGLLSDLASSSNIKILIDVNIGESTMKSIQIITNKSI